MHDHDGNGTQFFPLSFPLGEPPLLLLLLELQLLLLFLNKQGNHNGHNNE